jgi:predicted molibdopterin-dependent oxidoreductase YjgC
LAHGFGSSVPSLSWDELARRLQDGSIWGLYIVDRDVSRVWGKNSELLLSFPELVVFQGPFKMAGTSASAHFRLPATAFVEEDGHYTNCDGLVQGYRKVLEPLGDSRPDWAVFAALRERLREGRP